MKPVRVLFVCLGNICRSPTAQGVFENIVRESGKESEIIIDSAGTGAWHLGKSPDARSTEFAARRGYDLSSQRARQFHTDDFYEFDYILAMDHENFSDLEILKPANFTGKLGLFLHYSSQVEYEEVPDPYYGGDAGFELVLDLIEDASRGLLNEISGQ